MKRSKHITWFHQSCKVCLINNLVNVKILIESVIDPEENDIIFMNSAKKYNSSAGQCLLGVSFTLPNQEENKAKF